MNNALCACAIIGMENKFSVFSWVSLDFCTCVNSSNLQIRKLLQQQNYPFRYTPLHSLDNLVCFPFANMNHSAKII